MAIEKRGGDVCVALGCKTNYATCSEKLAVFTFPKEEDDPELRKKWEHFVNRGDNWTAKSRSVLCEKHFEKEFINKGEQRTHLKRKLRPIPTIHTEEAMEKPSCLNTPVPPRKAPKIRNFQNDELEDFRKKDIIKRFEDLTEKQCPPGYSFRSGHDHVVFYKLEFDAETHEKFLEVSKWIATCTFSVMETLFPFRFGLFKVRTLN